MRSEMEAPIGRNMAWHVSIVCIPATNNNIIIIHMHISLTQTSISLSLSWLIEWSLSNWWAYITNQWCNYILYIMPIKYNKFKFSIYLKSDSWITKMSVKGCFTDLIYNKTIQIQYDLNIPVEFERIQAFIKELLCTQYRLTLTFFEWSLQGQHPLRY